MDKELGRALQDFGDRHSADTEFFEGFLEVVQFEGFNGGFDQDHVGPCLSFNLRAGFTSGEMG